MIEPLFTVAFYLHVCHPCSPSSGSHAQVPWCQGWEWWVGNGLNSLDKGRGRLDSSRYLGVRATTCYALTMHSDARCPSAPLCDPESVHFLNLPFYDTGNSIYLA
jgi:hypothetical protein